MMGFKCRGIRRAFARRAPTMAFTNAKYPAATWLLAILLVVPSPSQAQLRTLEGQVVEALSNRPLVSVHLQAGRHQAFTDGRGRFSLSVDPGVQEVRAERLGYTSVSVAVEGWSGVIALSPRPIAMNELSVQGERRSELARGTALMVETVDHHQLHGRGHTSVAESLTDAEGVSMAWTGSWGARPMIRGLAGERLAMMVDGNRVNRACNFGMDQGLATVDPATVERVEILTGPGSALYGSGTLGGVVNVVTRRMDSDAPVSGELRMNAGSAAPGGAMGGTLAGRRGAFELSAGIDVTSVGDYRTPVATVEGSSYRQGTVDLKAAWEPDPSQRLSLAVQNYEGRDIGWPMGADAEIPEEGRTNVGLDYSWQRGGVLDALTVRGYAQQLRHHMVMRMTMSGGMDMGGGMGGDMSGGIPQTAPMTTVTDAQSDATSTGARLQFRLIPTSRSHLDMGVDYSHVAAEGTRWVERTGGAIAGGMSGGMAADMAGGMMPPAEEVFRTWPAVRIENAALFAQGELRASGRLALTAGVRGDHLGRTAEGWEAHRERVLTGNAGLRFELSPQWAARASVGRGFRIPDATEYFGLALRPDGFIYRGNPELGTETSLNVEASLAHRRGPLATSVTVYRNRMDDLIAPVAAPGEMVGGRPVRSYANVAEALLTGATFSADLDLGARANLSTVVNHVRGEDQATGDFLPQLPPTEGSITAQLRPFGDPARWMEFKFQGAARQTRTAVQLQELETPGYGVVGMRGGLELLGVQWVGGVDNILDKAYRSHVDPSPMLLRPGRNFHVSAVRRF